MAQETRFAQNLIDFIHASPSPFHVVKSIEDQLVAAGFSMLASEDRWTLEKGGKYYLTRNGSAIIAFVVGSGEMEDEGYRLVAAHTDAPLPVVPIRELCGVLGHTYIKRSPQALFGAE